MTSEYNEAYNDGVDRVITILEHKFGMDRKWLHHITLDLDECDCDILIEDEHACDVFNPPPPDEKMARERFMDAHVREFVIFQRRAMHRRQLAILEERGLLP